MFVSCLMPFYKLLLVSILPLYHSLCGINGKISFIFTIMDFPSNEVKTKVKQIIFFYCL